MFSYTKALEKPLCRKRDVMKVTFDISRYGKHTHSLVFETPLSEIEAIYEAEKWLSHEASREYYKMISDDLFLDRYEDYVFHEGKDPMRGDFLGDCKYLETVIRKGTEIVLGCGS